MPYTAKNPKGGTGMTDDKRLLETLPEYLRIDSETLSEEDMADRCSPCR
jgi:hypothetical protein